LDEDEVHTLNIAQVLKTAGNFGEASFAASKVRKATRYTFDWAGAIADSRQITAAATL